MHKLSVPYLFAVLLNHNTYLSKIIPDYLYLKIIYRGYMNKSLCFDNPKSFNEKIQWLKINKRKPEYTKMVDKYEAKEYVQGIIGEKYIIPTIGVWNRFEEIDFDRLPKQFVLKCTHDSGGLFICKDKSNLDFLAARKKISRSLKNNFYYLNREWPYKNVVPRIIAEQYLEENDSNGGLTDYKFFCFHGKAQFLYVSRGLENHKTAQISFYDLAGNELPFYRSDYRTLGKLALPCNYDEMLFCANTLAQSIDSPFVRIDLYSINNNVYFSEITFSPCGGLLPFTPEIWDLELGKLIQLDI